MKGLTDLPSIKMATDDEEWYVLICWHADCTCGRACVRQTQRLTAHRAVPCTATGYAPSFSARGS